MQMHDERSVFLLSFFLLGGSRNMNIHRSPQKDYISGKSSCYQQKYQKYCKHTLIRPGQERDKIIVWFKHQQIHSKEVQLLNSLC